MVRQPEYMENAFTSWAQKQQQQQRRVRRVVNRLAHPDVPLWLQHEGELRATILPGSATTHAVHEAAASLLNLDKKKKLTFTMNGRELRLGAAICESALANQPYMSAVVDVDYDDAPWYR